MSKGNTCGKVLRTALGRVQKGWVQNTWVYHDPVTGKTYVCLEGALFGYCNASRYGLTKPQEEARDLLLEIIGERYGMYAIPDFNDFPGRTQEEIEESLKLAIIRDETGGGDEDYLDEEETDKLLEFKDSMD